MWVNHHVVFEQIGRVDRTFLFVNVIFLMLVAFVPFPTRLVAEHLRDGDTRAAGEAMVRLATALWRPGDTTRSRDLLAPSTVSHGRILSGIAALDLTHRGGCDTGSSTGRL